MKSTQSGPNVVPALEVRADLAIAQIEVRECGKFLPRYGIVAGERAARPDRLEAVARLCIRQPGPVWLTPSGQTAARGDAAGVEAGCRRTDQAAGDRAIPAS